MTNWKEYKLGEVVNLAQGLAINAKTKHLLVNKGLPLLRITDLINNNQTQFINAELAPKQCIATKKDIIFTRTGQVGLVFKNKIGVIHNNCFKVIPNNNVLNNDYIYWFLKQPTIKEHVNSIASGSVQKDLNHSAFKSISINLPDLPTQTAIAEILSSLDDKIELNNKINQELENLAQTLFKQWFIDFEFPNENGEPYKSSGGEMVESELGEIPKGWEVKSLKDEFNLNMGQSPKGDTYNEIGEGMIFFQGRSDFGFRFPSVRMYTSDPKKIAKKFETLISVRAPVGDINMAESDCCIGRGLGSISHPKNYFSYTYYKMISIQSELKTYDNEGTVFGSINKETLGNIKNIIPPLKIVEQFNRLIEDNDALIYNVSCENQELTNLRDTLLPKLISGELEVADVMAENTK